MKSKKFKSLAVCSALAVGCGTTLTLALISMNSPFLLKGAVTQSFMEITAAQLESAMSGDGSFTVGSYDSWKAENLSFETNGGLRYAILSNNSAIRSTSYAGEQASGGYRGAGYTGITLLNKKSNASSNVQLLNSHGTIVGNVEIASGESDVENVDFGELIHPKGMVIGGISNDDNYLKFTSIRLNYTCEVEEHEYEYKHDNVYYWKECINCDEVSDKEFVIWQEGTPVDGVRVDSGANGLVSRTVSVWDGSSKSDSLSGTGTESDPYLINNANDLAYFSSSVMGGNTYSGKYISLTANVDINNNCLFLSGYSHTFAGTFDGMGHAILNNKLSVTSSLDGSANCSGLFRTAANGTVIKNLMVSGTSYAGQHVGGFIGYSHSATIQNCYNFVDVTSNTWNAGGFVGIVGTAPVTITDSINFGSVTGKGVADNVQVGGFVGNSTKQSVVTNSVNFGTITAQGGLGGFLGQGIGTVTSCSNFGVLNKTGSSSNVGDIVGTDAGVTSSNCVSGNFATYTSNSKKAEFDWRVGVVDSNGFRADTNEFYGYRKVSVWDGSSKSDSLSGTGTESDPYLINNANDLAKFAELSKDGSHTFSSQFVKLTTSIDLNNHPLTLGGYNTNVSFAGTFDGDNNYIIGQNLTNEQSVSNTLGLFPTLAYSSRIKNLALDGSISGVSNAGALVGMSNSGGISNCYNFASVNITTECGGGLVGKTTHAGAVITGCYNFGAVKTTGTGEVAGVGGIAGQLNALITNCENYGTISGAKYCGGFVGKLANGTISYSTNFSNITINTTTAGIAGDGYGTIDNCVNRGNIKATGGYAGGILGTQRSGKVTITNSHNYGTVTGGSYVGGIIGALVTGSKANVITNCVNDGAISGANYVAGVVGGLISWVNADNTAIKGCTNNASINGSDYVAGICGKLFGTYFNCVNAGTLTYTGSNHGELFASGTYTEQE